MLDIGAGPCKGRQKALCGPCLNERLGRSSRAGGECIIHKQHPSARKTRQGILLSHKSILDVSPALSQVQPDLSGTSVRSLERLLTWPA